MAHVSPIPKGGVRSALSKYRPISLLCALEKTIERLVFKHFCYHLNHNNILTSLQSGFIPGDSTVNQLTFLYNTFCQTLDSGKEVWVVFCNTSIATFDRVWPERLLFKLQAVDISGNLLWFRCYLSNRNQRDVLLVAESN